MRRLPRQIPALLILSIFRVFSVFLSIRTLSVPSCWLECPRVTVNCDNNFARCIMRQKMRRHLALYVVALSIVDCEAHRSFFPM
jgi:hypothetical protein